MPSVFLTAEWRDLVMLNYQVDPALLEPFVPAGTILDSFDGESYVSLVAFRFLHTKLGGSVAVPFHTSFEEVNLRFYVRREVDGEIRRGVVFIAEIVPKWAVATVARIAYGENYICLPMDFAIFVNGGVTRLLYRYQHNGNWCAIQGSEIGAPALAEEGSLEQFITEHYWGYSNQRDGSSLEYRVEHVPWNVWQSPSAKFEGDASSLYGSAFGEILQRPPPIQPSSPTAHQSASTQESRCSSVAHAVQRAVSTFVSRFLAVLPLQ